MTMQYGTDWQEVIAPGEEAVLEALAQRLVAVQESRDKKYAEQGRALHRKGQGGARGTFTVRADLADVLPPELHVGPFQPGARYGVVARFSNGSFQRSPDKVPDIRGIAFKLLDVGGKKALTGTEEPRAQDFLLILDANTPMSSPDEFVTLVETANGGSQATLLPRLIWAIGLFPALKILRGILAGMRQKFFGFPSGRFHSATPYRFGPSAARFGLAPVGEHPPAEAGGRDFYADHVRQTQQQGMAWDFQVQLYQDAGTTPIEDNTVPWTEQASPFVTIGRLELPATDITSEAFVALQTEIEQMTFDPWQCVEELRPVGALNRARKHAYYASMKHRGVLE